MQLKPDPLGGRSTRILEHLGNLGDFVGGIAVVVTLIYLAGQVRHNTNAMRTASRQDIVTGYRAHNSRFLDSSVAEAFAVGIRDYPDMPADQKRIFSYSISDHLLFFQSAFALYEAGILERETYEAYLTWIACHLSTPGGSSWWNEGDNFYPQRMVDAIERRLHEGSLPGILGLPFFALDQHPDASNSGPALPTAAQQADEPDVE